MHPQHWPADLDYAGKRVVVIGSGATAVTLVPAMASTAAHVTMLQRSPSYILSLPAHDPVAQFLPRLLPATAAFRLVRWKNIVVSLAIYMLSRRAPNLARRLLRYATATNLPEGYAIDKHFNPRYRPWEQRLCFVPDSDLFQAISAGRASLVTDQIETFTEHGIHLQSGEQLDADIIVSATGLQMLALGGIHLTVDGTPVNPGQAFTYKGVLLSNVPNFAFSIGYTNASWTLRADLASTFVCRVLNHMDRRGYSTCRPICDPARLESKPLLDLTSGYVLRAAPGLPKQADQKPWLIRQNYILDMLTMKLGRIEDGILRFGTSVSLGSTDVPEDTLTAADGD